MLAPLWFTQHINMFFFSVMLLSFKPPVAVCLCSALFWCNGSWPVQAQSPCTPLLGCAGSIDSCIQIYVWDRANHFD